MKGKDTHMHKHYDMKSCMVMR